MQKKLLTLAVAGALAAPAVSFAQSSVEVYGYLNMSLGFWKYSEGAAGGGAQNVSGASGLPTAAPSVSKWDVTSAASNVGVRGRETLGGGLSAWFQIETNAPFERSNNVAHTSGFASRNSAVGLQGNWGNVFLGQWTTPWADLDALWSIGTVGGFGPVTSIIGRRETTGSAPNMNCGNTAVFGSGNTAVQGGACDSVEGSGGVGHPFWRRASNSVSYQSPVVAGGLQGKFLWQVPQDKTPGGTSLAGTPTFAQQDPQMWSASLQWAGMGGRARIGAAYDRHKDFTTVGKSDTGWSVKGGYNFGVVDIGLAFEEMKYQAAFSECKAKQYAIAAAVPVGQGAIRASYSVAKDIQGDYGANPASFTPAPTNAFAVNGASGVVGGTATNNAFCNAPTTNATAAAAAADNGAKQWNLGYDHRMSKRTTLGVGYAEIKNDNGAAPNQFVWSGMSSLSQGVSVSGPTGGVKISVFFANIVHRF
jgi:predicted porin